MTTDWHAKTIQTLQLNGKGERSREAYVRSVRFVDMDRLTGVAFEVWAWSNSELWEPYATDHYRLMQR